MFRQGRATRRHRQPALPAVELAASALVLPAPALQLSGSLTVGVTLVGVLALPSLQITSGSITVAPRALDGAILLPVLQLSGSLTMGVSPVTAILDFSTATITGSGYSSVPDLLGGSAAVQATDANRPPNLDSGNGLPQPDFDGASDFLSWAASAARNNQTDCAGYATWVQFDSVADGITGIFGALPGATNRIEISKNNATMFVNVYHSQFAARRGTAPAAIFAAGGRYFLTWEWYKDGADDAAKCVITLDEVVLTLTFTNDGGGSAMPAALVATAGPFAIGARRASDGLGPMNGRQGNKIMTLGARVPGATHGLLTPEVRSALRNYSRPTT